MGIPMDDATNTHLNSMSKIYDTPKPECGLQKKNNSIPYHTVLEFVEMGESLTAHKNDNENLMDLLTKI